jgi:hypothetical protein
VGKGGGEVNSRTWLPLIAAQLLAKEHRPLEIIDLPGQKSWREYHIPKAMRKGKTPDELDALRKALWEQEKEANRETGSETLGFDKASI